MSEWKQHVVQQQIEAFRSGWLGVWDALVSVVLRRPRLAVPQTVTLSFWAKTSPKTEIEASITQVEIK